jgi:hypothetical protein
MLREASHGTDSDLLPATHANKKSPVRQKLPELGPTAVITKSEENFLYVFLSDSAKSRMAVSIVNFDV